jgi:hypothetical protein
MFSCGGGDIISSEQLAIVYTTLMYMQYCTKKYDKADIHCLEEAESCLKMKIGDGRRCTAALKRMTGACNRNTTAA